MFINKKAQSVMEYLMLVTIVIGAFIGIGVYFKRGIQGRWKQAVDGLGDQYDPRVTNTDIVESSTGKSATRVLAIPVSGGVWTMRTDNTNSIETKTGSSRVGAF